VRVLRLSQSGWPVAWISQNHAVTLYASEQVIWQLGDHIKTVYGGLNHDGERSHIEIAPIIASLGEVKSPNKHAPLDNQLLFRRDDYRCLYCGEQFERLALSRDHVIPRAQGGRDIWTNVVTACKRCNHRKGARTPEEANMPLLAVPFEPNPYESLYLANHRIQADQMEYLQSRFSCHREWLVA